MVNVEKLVSCAVHARGGTLRTFTPVTTREHVLGFAVSFAGRSDIHLRVEAPPDAAKPGNLIEQVSAMLDYHLSMPQEQKGAP